MILSDTKELALEQLLEMCGPFQIIASFPRSHLLLCFLLGTGRIPAGREYSRKEAAAGLVLSFFPGEPACARNEVSSAHITKWPFLPHWDLGLNLKCQEF